MQAMRTHATEAYVCLHLTRGLLCSLKSEALKMIHKLLDTLATGDHDAVSDDLTASIDILLLRIQGLTGCKSVGSFTGFAICNGTQDDPTVNSWTPIWAGSVWYNGTEPLKWKPLKSGDSADAQEVTPTRGHKYCGLVNGCVSTAQLAERCTGPCVNVHVAEDRLVHILAAAFATRSSQLKLAPHSSIFYASDKAACSTYWLCHHFISSVNLVGVLQFW
jgi:hypothetical protein